MPLPLSLMVLILVTSLPFSRAAVTIYTTFPGEPTTTASTPSETSSYYSGYAAFDPRALSVPAPPKPPQATVLPVQLWSGGMPGLSIPQKGNFLGLSVEFSIADQIIGKNASLLNVPFLNYLANIHVRAGAGPVVRIGGSSQDNTNLVDSGLPGGSDMDKVQPSGSLGGSSDSDIIDFSPELLYAMSNVSALVGTQWYLGLSFNSTQADGNTLLVAQYAQEILADSLLALQLGNEPDQYGTNGRRPKTYDIQDYISDFTKVTGDLNNVSALTNNETLIGPSVCCAWTIQEILDAGYVSEFSYDLAEISVQHYPESNCNGTIAKAASLTESQIIFPTYLNHTAATSFVQPYLNASSELSVAGKPFVMLETNTASCGGFLGISDSFGATLWAVDMALQLAAANFSHALLHNSGSDVYYNAIAPPPGNETKTKQWNTGSTYYALLAVAETFGSSNVSQIIDLETSNTSIYAPSYAIYENDSPTRVALFNFVSDPSGANDYDAIIAVGGGQTGQPNATPDSVSVRYLTAPSVSEKYNISWAGQTLGGAPQASDGRLQGEVVTETISCDASAGTCTVPMRAPSFALVFLTPQALQASSPEAGMPISYSSTVTARGSGWSASVTVNPTALATSNGHGGAGGGAVGTTSNESNGMSAGPSLQTLVGTLSVAVVAVAVGWAVAC